jgi:hypothetical protein
MTNSIKFHDDYSISYKGEKVLLLPKEFALFSFLYNNSNMTLSREMILNRVWGLSESMDRTVDDHIYRIRRKLGFIDIISIKTIRSAGYRLILNTADFVNNPLLKDADFQSALDLLFEKYISYGQGKGLTMLSNQQEDMDMSLNPEKQMYIRFIKGDFVRLIQDPELPFWSKGFYLLHIYSIIQFNPINTLSLFEALIKEEKLPPRFQHELSKILIIERYIRVGQFTLSKQEIDALYLNLDIGEKKALYYYVCNLELKLYLFSGAWASALSLINARKTFFDECSFQREKGQFIILTGLYFLLNNTDKDLELGESLLFNGLEILDKSSFKPSYINGLNLILTLFQEYGFEGKISSSINNRWNKLSKAFSFSFLEKEIMKQLTEHGFI